jgi:phosphoesterase RecJ-like protein
MYRETEQIKEIVESANKILIVQADNPDADSLGSALALENILGELGKEPLLYASVDMPTYLRYLPGWDRVSSELPKDFDVSFIVDASTLTLFEKLQAAGGMKRLSQKPSIVLDHHASVENVIPFASVLLNDPKRSSAGELVYIVASEAGWPVSSATEELLMSSILGDTQGLTNQLTSPETYRIMAKFVEDGVDRPKLEEIRREYGKMAPEIFRYKAELISRTEFSAEGRIAAVAIPQKEINTYSPLYNPAPLIQGDMLQTTGVEIAIVLKSYNDGRVTAAIRSNAMAPIAAKLAEHFGGGGHPFASGFKVTDGRTLSDIRSSCIAYTTELLDKLESSK